MFKRILLPTDGSKQSERAVLAGLRLARQLGADAVGLTVIPRFGALPLDPEALGNDADLANGSAAALATGYLDFVASAAAEAGVTCACDCDSADAPWQAIIDTARTRRCDLIVMASHGRHGVVALLLGSETKQVLVHSTIPVLVYR